jgi:1-acyl-sn-glycerol-3-phosphate acyltransferase
MGKAELFENPALNWFFRKTGGFPVHRGESDITAVKTAIQVLKSGDNLLIFPEGTVIRDGIRMDLQVTLDEKPVDLNQPQPDMEEEMPEGDYEEWYDFFFGDGE